MFRAAQTLTRSSNSYSQMSLFGAIATLSQTTLDEGKTIFCPFAVLACFSHERFIPQLMFSRLVLS